MKKELLLIAILVSLAYASMAQQYCYIMDDTQTHPTLGFYTTKLGVPSTSFACPNNIGQSTQQYEPTSQNFKSPTLCYAFDPWTYMRSQMHAGTYRNCKAGPFCGFMISPIAIVQCPLDESAIVLFLLLGLFGFFVIRKQNRLSGDPDLIPVCLTSKSKYSIHKKLSLILQDANSRIIL